MTKYYCTDEAFEVAVLMFEGCVISLTSQNGIYEIVDPDFEENVSNCKIVGTIGVSLLQRIKNQKNVSKQILSFEPNVALPYLVWKEQHSKYKVKIVKEEN